MSLSIPYVCLLLVASPFIFPSMTSLSVHFTSSILLQYHISKLLTLLVVSAEKARSSAPYVAMLHIKHFTNNLFFRSQFSSLVNIFLCSTNFYFANTILSPDMVYPSSVIIVPKEVNPVTCPIEVPSIEIFIWLGSFVMHITYVFPTCNVDNRKRFISIERFCEHVVVELPLNYLLSVSL